MATISSAEPFQLRGASVPVRGVPDWPLSAGDEIATGAAPAMISFADGSRVYLNSHTRAKLHVAGKQNVLRLVQGDLAYKVNKNSRISLAGLNREPLPGDSSEGLLSIDSQAAVWAPKGFDPAAAGNSVVLQQYRNHSLQFVLREPVAQLHAAIRSAAGFADRRQLDAAATRRKLAPSRFRQSATASRKTFRVRSSAKGDSDESAAENSIFDNSVCYLYFYDGRTALWPGPRPYLRPMER